MIMAYRGRGQGRGGWQPRPMTTKRVKSIAKREDQRRDDRSIMTCMKMCDFLPRITTEPKSGIVVRAQMLSVWGTDNTVSIKSANVTGDQIYFSRELIERQHLETIETLEELDQKIFGDQESDENITLEKEGEDVKADK